MRRVLQRARLAFFLVLANTVFLTAGLAATPKSPDPEVPPRALLECLSANDVLKNLYQTQKGIQIDFLDQLHGLIFLSGMKDLAKSTILTPPEDVTGVMLAYVPGQKSVLVGILVGDRLCEYSQLPLEAAIAIFKSGSEA